MCTLVSLAGPPLYTNNSECAVGGTSHGAIRTPCFTATVIIAQQHQTLSIVKSIRHLREP